MNEKSFNCKKCNLPIYPPKLPEGINFKDKFDQIRCIGCNEINSYTQSQEYKFYLKEEKTKVSQNLYGQEPTGLNAVLLFIWIWLIAVVIEGDLEPTILIALGIFTILHFSRNIIKKKFIGLLKYIDFLKKN